MIYEIIDSTDDDGAVYEDPDISIEVDVNGDIYGGSQSDYFQQEADINVIIDLGNEVRL